MNSFNKFIGLGNLTRDPETKYTPNGVAVCSFGIAMNHKYKQGTETKDEVCYLDVIVFGKFADVCQKYLTKGQGVLVEGRIRQRRWNDKESGAPRTKYELVAAVVNFMPKKQGAVDHGADVPTQVSEAFPGAEAVDEGPIPF